MANRTDFSGTSLLPTIYTVMKEERLNAVSELLQIGQHRGNFHIVSC